MRGMTNAVIGGFLGILAIGAARFTTLLELGNGAGPHYHANFAVFVDGERLDLSAMHYMQDIAACKANPDLILPVERAHLHEGIHDVVHVHHEGATWGHFFTNIGFALGDNFLITDRGERHFTAAGQTFKFVVDGLDVPSIYNNVIESEERVLISFGSETLDEILETQFAELPSTANSFNQFHQDAGGCTASEPAPETTGEKLRRAFWF
jgi:hypothetical protein